MLNVIFLIMFTSIFFAVNGALNENRLQQDISLEVERENGTVLSRKRRYLVFPAGSSFQVVFCLTYPTLGVGSYFVFGHTAALAWELPSTPLFYNIKDYEKKAEEDAAAETTTTEIPHDIDLSSLDHGGVDQNDHHRISNDFLPLKPNYGGNDGFSKWPTSHVSRQPVSSYNNPFMNFLKTTGYSTIENSGYDNLDNKLNVKNNWGNNDNFRRFGNTGTTYPGRVGSNSFQRPKQKESLRTSYISPTFYSVHRRTRRDLYKKIENFLVALNMDGKSCLLKAICEVTQSSKERGSFLEEIIKAIFRVKPHDDYPNEDTYDHAANSTHNCKEMYPGCKGTVWSNLFLFKK